jgi:hypothetical protein
MDRAHVGETDTKLWSLNLKRRELRRSRRGWDTVIIYLKENNWCEGVDWIQLPEDVIRLRVYLEYGSEP